jgi:hypothetical protein
MYRKMDHNKHQDPAFAGSYAFKTQSNALELPINLEPVEDRMMNSFVSGAL